MAKYIDTWRGKIKVESAAGVDTDNVYVVDCAKVNEIVPGSYPPDVWQHYLVPDEDQFIERLKEVAGENPASERPSFLSLYRQGL